MKSKQRKRGIRNNKSKRHKVYRGGLTSDDPKYVDGFPSFFENGRMIPFTPAEETKSSSGSGSTLITTGVVVVGVGALLTVLLMRR